MKTVIFKKSFITPPDVKEVLEIIAMNAQEDAESSHMLETALHQAVLYYIAIGQCEEPRDCAKLALESLKTEFERWTL